MSTSPREVWVRGLLPYAQEWEAKTGIPANIWLAMAASESNWGAAGNSLFGIKGSGSAGSLSSPTWESEGGQRVGTTADFASYNNPNEAFQAFWNLVSTSPRYATAMQHLPNDPQEFLQEINKAGYATDPKWASTIQNIASTSIDPMIGSSSLASGRSHIMGTNQDQTTPLTPDEISQIRGGDPSGALSPDTVSSAYAQPSGSTSPSTDSSSINPGLYSKDNWQSIADNHGGIASVSSSRSVLVPDPNDALGKQKIRQADPNAPSLVAFNDGTIVLAKLGLQDPLHPDAVQVVGLPGSQRNTEVRTFPDGSLNERQQDGSWKQIAPAPDLTDKKTPRTLSLSDGRVLQYNWDTHNWDLIAQSSKSMAPQTINWPDGSIHRYDPTTGDWPQIAPPNPQVQQEATLRIAQAQRNILPAQQKMFQDAYDSIDMIKQKAASGQISWQDANNLVTEIHSGLQASLEGTTLFDKFKQQQDQQRAQASEASGLLRQRVQEGSSLAHSLLSAAAGHVLMPAGKTSLGIDPYAIAKAETTDLGGGEDLFNKARDTLQSFMQGNPAMGNNSSSPPGGSSTPNSLQALLASVLSSQGGGGVADMYPAESGTLRQQELAPRGPGIRQALLQSLGAGG